MVDLKAIAKDASYRVCLDESVIGDRERANRVWYYRVSCRYGHIFVHSESELGAYTDHSRVMSRLEAIPGVRVRQRGDLEMSVAFEPSCLEVVASLLQARRKRRVSEEERQRLRAISPLTRVAPEPR